MDRIERRSRKVLGTLVVFTAHRAFLEIAWEDTVGVVLASSLSWQGSRRIAKLILALLTTIEQSYEPGNSRHC